MKPPPVHQLSAANKTSPLSTAVAMPARATFGAITSSVRKVAAGRDDRRLLGIDRRDEA